MKKQKLNYFKLRRRGNRYDYIKVTGGAGKTKEGFQEVIRFEKPVPVISTEHNFLADRSGKTGTWTTFEKGVPIPEEEYEEAYSRASRKDFDCIVDNKPMAGIMNIYGILLGWSKKGKLTKKEVETILKLIAAL